MNIIGYSYDADIKCIDCTISDYEDGFLTQVEWDESGIDENDLPYNLAGQEKNVIMPVFDTDEVDNSCGACLIPLVDGYDHACGEWADECMDGYCELGINPCATHYEESCVEGCEYED